MDRGQPFDALIGHADGRRGRLCSFAVRRCLTLILCGCLVSLTPLASASPPDPLWIEGVYDGADADDVVEAATSMAGGHGGAPLVGLRPVLIIIGFVSLDDPVNGVLAAALALHFRSPPSS